MLQLRLECRINEGWLSFMCSQEGVADLQHVGSCRAVSLVIVYLITLYNALRQLPVVRLVRIAFECHFGVRLTKEKNEMNDNV